MGSKLNRLNLEFLTLPVGEGTLGQNKFVSIPLLLDLQLEGPSQPFLSPSLVLPAAFCLLILISLGANPSQPRLCLMTYSGCLQKASAALKFHPLPGIAFIKALLSFRK